jgi:hypothetical protein
MNAVAVFSCLNFPVINLFENKSFQFFDLKAFMFYPFLVLLFV